jgi:hypothetical protein
MIHVPSGTGLTVPVQVCSARSGPHWGLKGEACRAQTIACGPWRAEAKKPGWTAQ